MPRRDQIIALLTVLVFVVVAGFMAGCSDDETDNTVVEALPVLTATCEGCHMDSEMLQATADPEEEPPGETDPGEG